MKAGEARVGQWVVYRPHPAAEAEDGEITEVREAGMVMVRYAGDRGAKATHLRDLTLGAGDTVTIDSPPVTATE